MTARPPPLVLGDRVRVVSPLKAAATLLGRIGTVVGGPAEVDGAVCVVVRFGVGHVVMVPVAWLEASP